MVIFKTYADTLPVVLSTAKHAFTSPPRNIQPGELVLVSQTRTSLPKGMKSIRYTMEYVRTYLDTMNETDALWGRHWNYIVECTNVREVEPFHIEDIQRTGTYYAKALSFAYVDAEDEIAISAWLGLEAVALSDEREILLDSLTDLPHKDPLGLIARLDAKYAGTPRYRDYVVSRIQRPSRLRDAILSRDGTRCSLCKQEGFMMASGKQYAEVHHMIELNRQAPDTLQSWNVMIVCPTCHKKLHYAPVTTEFLDPGWKLTIDGKEHILC